MKYQIFLSTLFALLVIGAGCTSQNTPVNQPTNAATETQQDDVTPADSTDDTAANDSCITEGKQPGADTCCAGLEPVAVDASATLCMPLGTEPWSASDCASIGDTPTIQNKCCTGLTGVPGDNNSITCQDVAIISTPSTNETIGTNFTVTGQAPGTWYSEGVFNITVLDSEGKQIAHTLAIAQDEWMTTDLVSFSAALSVPEGTAGKATINLHKANASGLPDNAKSQSVLVVFE